MYHSKNQKKFIALLTIVIVVLFLGFMSTFILSSFLGSILAIAAPIVLSYNFLKKQHRSIKKALIRLAGQFLLGIFLLGLTLGKIDWSDNGMVIAIYAVGILFTIINFLNSRKSKKNIY